MSLAGLQTTWLAALSPALPELAGQAIPMSASQAPTAMLPDNDWVSSSLSTPQPFLKLLLSSEASQEVAMEMGPQAEHDNDLGPGGVAVGARAPLDTRLAHVLSPRKDVRAQLRRIEGPEQEQGFLPTCPARSLSLSRIHRALKIQGLFGSNRRMLSKWVQPQGKGREHYKQTACHRSYIPPHRSGV